LSRRDDWVGQMWSAIEDHTDAPFVWGLNDCCLFAARVVDAMTDSDFELELSSQYSDEETALAYIASHGSLEAAVTSHLGDPSPGRALRGDVVMVDGGNGHALGICVGGTVAALTDKGPLFMPRSAIITRWAIE